MNVDRTVEAVVVALGDGFEELLARFHTAFCAGEGGEQFKLQRGEQKRFFAEHGDACAGIDPQRADHDLRLVACRAVRG